jgi:hypothetical protein
VKFLKVFFGLFFVLFVPIMALVAFMTPKRPGISVTDVMVQTAKPIGFILFIVSLGFAFINQAMDASKTKQ